MHESHTIFRLATDLRDDPDKVARADRMLNIPDLLNYFLTGKMVNEYTILSTGAIPDAKKRDYAFELLDKVGIPQRLFGEIAQPGNKVGKLLPQVPEETGKTDADVLNVASHDTASAVSQFRHRRMISSSSAAERGRSWEPSCKSRRLTARHGMLHIILSVHSTDEKLPVSAALRR